VLGLDVADDGLDGGASPHLALDRRRHVPPLPGDDDPVHTWMEEQINGPKTVPRSPPRDPNFRAELSLVESKFEDYGVAGTRRIDVYENPGSGTVCIYDIKTGRSGLKPARMPELASAVQYYYPGTQRIIVTEVRPRR
jgi:hypothetical protein